MISEDDMLNNLASSRTGMQLTGHKANEGRGGPDRLQRLLYLYDLDPSSRHFAVSPRGTSL